MIDDPAGVPLPPATFHILIALADEDRHGYAILRDVTERTSGRFHLGPATLYTSIKRMLDAGLIEETGPPAAADADPRRRYYHLTGLGRRVALAEAARMEAVLDQARARFGARARRKKT